MENDGHEEEQIYRRTVRLIERVQIVGEIKKKSKVAKGSPFTKLPYFSVLHRKLKRFFLLLIQTELCSGAGKLEKNISYQF